MRKDTTPANMLFDRRVVERNLRKGVVTREEYDQWLANLADSTPNSEVIRATLGEDGDEAELDDELDGDDDGDDDDAEA